MPSTATIEPNRLLILSTLIMSGTLVVSAGGRPDPRGTRELRGRPGGRKLPRLGGPRAEPLQGARESRSGRKTPDPGRGFSPDAAQTPGTGRRFGGSAGALDRAVEAALLPGRGVLVDHVALRGLVDEPHRLRQRRARGLGVARLDVAQHALHLGAHAARERLVEQPLLLVLA